MFKFNVSCRAVKKTPTGYTIYLWIEGFPTGLETYLKMAYSTIFKIGSGYEVVQWIGSDNPDEIIESVMGELEKLNSLLTGQSPVERDVKTRLDTLLRENIPSQ